MMNKLAASSLLVLIFSTGSWAFSQDDLEKTIEDEIAGKLVLIPKGEFLMGCTEDEIESRPSERPQHKVVFEKPFYMGAYEVTYGEFRRFVSATGYKTEVELKHTGSGFDKKIRDIVRGGHYSWTNPGFKQKDSHPVVNVSWNDAVAYCQWLTDEDGDHFYRLPTEAEREYAGRGGTSTTYCWGKNAISLVLNENVADRSLSSILSQSSKTRSLCAKWKDRYPFTAPVGSFKPNGFGLYDTHGNAQEWCQEFYDKNRYLKPKNYKPLPDPQRVTRGGTCLYRAEACRVARRFSYPPNLSRCDIGFRIVRDIE